MAEFKPDLILLDIMMPKLSGFEVCKTLKRDEATKDIMILMVTALNELGDIERAVACGCDDFLSKPVNKIELLKRVENMLKLRYVTDELERLRRYIDSMGRRGRGPGNWGEKKSPPTASAGHAWAVLRRDKPGGSLNVGSLNGARGTSPQRGASTTLMCWAMRWPVCCSGTKPRAPLMPTCRPR